MSNIHREVVFAAPAARVYRAIVNLAEFSEGVRSTGRGRGNGRRLVLRVRRSHHRTERRAGPEQPHRAGMAREDLARRQVFARPLRAPRRGGRDPARLRPGWIPRRPEGAPLQGMARELLGAESASTSADAPEEPSRSRSIRALRRARSFWFARGMAAAIRGADDLGESARLAAVRRVIFVLPSPSGSQV